MEQEYVAGLYQSLGMSVGAELSSEDVSFLYRKVFHVSSSTSEAHAAMKKITQSDSSRSCAGENIIDVLLEMQREREKKELLYWDLQLLNAGNLNHMMDWMQQSTHPGTLEMAYNSDLGSSQSCTTETAGPQMMKRKLCDRMTNVRKLKKAARQCWARLVTEGVQSLLPSFCKAQGGEIRCRAWGCVSLSDLLLLVEVKYDVVTHLLYTEMLQEHHTEGIWKMLLPWQQHREEEGLEELAEEALESADVLCMARLPGAFRIYKDIHTRTTVSVNGFGQKCLESQCWTAVSFLNDLHILRQHERHTLTVLSQRLDEESFRLVCLHIRLATLRAQREKKSYSALLAARQSWETWPHVYSPCRAEQVNLWLFGGNEEKEEEAEEQTRTLEQQALLQLLVLVQEHERKHLLRLVHEVSPEDSQGPGCTVPSKDSSHMHAALRNGCRQRLSQIDAWLQRHNQSETHLEPTDLQLKPQFQLENCGLLLLTHLMELQEIQASALLQALVDNKIHHIQALRDEYRSEIQAKCFSNLLHLLTSDEPFTSGPAGHSHWIEKSGSEKANAQSRYTRLVDEAQNVSGGFTEAQLDISSKGAGGDVNEVQPTDEPDKQDLRSGCGAVMEELPYLEISCVPDAKSDAQEIPPAEGRAQTEDKGGATKTQESYEKQGSLITLAWSKLPDDGTDNEAEAAAGGAGHNLNAESSEKTQIQPPQSKEKNDECNLLQCTSAGQRDAQPANLQSSTVEQMILNVTPMSDQPKEGQAISECDPQTHSPGAESLQDIQPPLYAEPPETNPHVDDPYSETSNDVAHAGKEVTVVEMSPAADESELRDLPEAESCHHDSQKCHPEAAVDCSLSEIKTEKEQTLTGRERVGEPVSAMERERTMRNLVDMQRKYEQRQQRDRERQLLRVQERLSIIQNRKAEEDLLGLKHTDRLKHLTHDLLLEDRNQQKTIVKERLEQLRRERSYIMQSKRDRNTAGFKELLGPVVLHSRETEDGADWDTTTV